MNTAIRNWWTTVFGVIGAIANQASGPGFVIPTTGREWFQTVFTFVLIAFGVAAKDATTGSKPGG
jgi:hypothetical protein